MKIQRIDRKLIVDIKCNNAYIRNYDVLEHYLFHQPLKFVYFEHDHLKKTYIYRSLIERTGKRWKAPFESLFLKSL